MSWDACQREVLDALGHTLYRLAGAEASPPSAAMPAVASRAASDQVVLTRLQRALLRAAGHDDASDPALQPLLAVALGLHANPAAKRALWPRLRALRRDSTGHGSRG